MKKAQVESKPFATLTIHFCHFESNFDYSFCRLVHFPGDTLWQGEDDKKLVTLIRKNREVQVMRPSMLSLKKKVEPSKNYHLGLFLTRQKLLFTIQVYFEHTRQLLPNNPGSNTVIGEPLFLSYYILLFSAIESHRPLER